MLISGARLAVVVLALVAPAALAQDDQVGLAFRDVRPLMLGWEEASAPGGRAEVCNLGPGVAQDLQLTTSGFGFMSTRAGASEAEPVPDADVVSVMFDNDPPASGSAALERLASGECREVVITRVGMDLDAGSYDGALVVTGARGGIARLTVTIAGPSAAPATPELAGAADPVALSGDRDGFGEDSVSLNAGGKLLLAPKTAATVKLGASCEPDTLDDETKCPLAGNLYNGSHVARVYVAGKAQDNSVAGPATLPVRVLGAGHPGTFTGSLDLAATPAKADDDVKVTLTVTDHWIRAVLALLVGLAVALLPQLWLRRWRPKDTLHARHDEFEQGYRNGLAAFENRPTKFAGMAAPSPTQVDEASADNKAAIDRYAKSTVYFDATNDAYKEVDKSLKLVETDIAYWSETDGLYAALDGLDAEFEKLLSMLPRFGAPEEPAIVSTLAATLKGRELKVGGALRLAEKAKEAKALAAQWRELAETVLRYELWSRRLTGAVHDGWPPGDRAQLLEAQIRIAEARRELRAVKDVAQLEQIGTKADLWRTYDRLARLGAPRDIWETEGPAEPAGVDILLPQVVGEHFAIPDVSPAHKAARIAEEEAPDATPAKAVTFNQSTRMLFDAAVIALTLVVGVVVGLATFYFGKTWGTFTDYLTVIVAGAAAQVFLTGIVAAVEKLLPAVPEKLIASGAAPAAIAEAEPAT